MKTRIKIIIITAVALFFVSVGVSFAHDGKREHHKLRGNAHGNYKNGYDDHHGWYNKHHKPRRHPYRHYKKWHGHHYRWHKKHYKRRHHNRDRHRYREVHRCHHHYHHYYDHHALHEGTIIGFKLKEPGFKFAVVVKDHR